MSLEYGRSEENRQGEVGQEQEMIERLAKGLEPLLERLDAYLDKRLVRTLVESVAAILAFRNPKQGLHVSELGAYIKNGAQAPAGTKKLERLLHSEKMALPQLPCSAQAAFKTRCRNNSKLPRPNIGHLINFNLLIYPSTGPLLYGKVRAALTGSYSFCNPSANV